jgi:hypothetical protein
MTEAMRRAAIDQLNIPSAVPRHASHAKHGVQNVKTDMPSATVKQSFALPIR